MASLIPAVSRPGHLSVPDDDMEVSSDIGRPRDHDDDLIDIDFDEVLDHEHEEDENMVDDNAEVDDEMSDERADPPPTNIPDEELRDASDRGDGDIDLITETEQPTEDVEVNDFLFDDAPLAAPQDSTAEPAFKAPDLVSSPLAASNDAPHEPEAKSSSSPSDEKVSANARSGGDSDTAAEVHEDDFDFGPPHEGDEASQAGVDEAGDAKPMKHKLETSSSSDSFSHPCPIIVYTDTDDFDYHEESLFPTAEDENSFVDDVSLFHQPLQNLLERCRVRLCGEEDYSRQIVLRFDRLGLRIAQDNASASTCCLENIVDVYCNLFVNQGDQVPTPLYIHLSAEESFYQRFTQLRNDSLAGKSFHDVALPDPFIDSSRDYVPSDVESAEYDGGVSLSPGGHSEPQSNQQSQVQLDAPQSQELSGNQQNDIHEVNEGDASEPVVVSSLINANKEVDSHRKDDAELAEEVDAAGIPGDEPAEKESLGKESVGEVRVSDNVKYAAEGQEGPEKASESGKAAVSQLAEAIPPPSADHSADAKADDEEPDLDLGDGDEDVHTRDEDGHLQQAVTDQADDLPPESDFVHLEDGVTGADEPADSGELEEDFAEEHEEHEELEEHGEYDEHDEQDVEEGTDHPVAGDAAHATEPAVDQKEPAADDDFDLDSLLSYGDEEDETPNVSDPHTGSITTADEDAVNMSAPSRKRSHDEVATNGAEDDSEAKKARAQ